MTAIGRFEPILRDAGCSQSVIEHCRAVYACAQAFTHEFPVDTDLIETGAMLHDIGRGHTHSIAHAQEGAEICRSLGYPEAVVRIVETHIGAGLTADECSLLGLVPRDCTPRTLEEKIVANADNLVVGTEEISIEHRLLRSPHLPKKTRQRMFRLALEMELFR